MDSLAEPSMLLVARRSAPEQLAGLWEFPGGKVEPGEQCEAALHRELREELGIGVKTVETHRLHAREKLGLGTAAQCRAYAEEQGWL